MGDYIGALHEQQIADLRRDREELDARIVQLETTGQALLAELKDAARCESDAHGVWTSTEADEFRAVLDGNATPTDR